MAKKDKDRSGLLIPAGLFIGMGIGFVLDQLVGYMFVGLGVGFAAMAIVRLKK